MKTKRPITTLDIAVAGKNQMDLQLICGLLLSVGRRKADKKLIITERENRIVKYIEENGSISNKEAREILGLDKNSDAL